MHDVTIHELKEVVALRGLPDEHLQWILERSIYQELEDGAVLLKVKDPVDVMWILLEGNVSFYMDINGRLVYYFTFSNDEDTGGVGGLLPYSRMKNSPGYSYAIGKVRLLRLHKKYFPDRCDPVPQMDSQCCEWCGMPCREWWADLPGTHPSGSRGLLLK